MSLFSLVTVVFAALVLCALAAPAGAETEASLPTSTTSATVTEVAAAASEATESTPVQEAVASVDSATAAAAEPSSAVSSTTESVVSSATTPSETSAAVTSSVREVAKAATSSIEETAPETAEKVVGQNLAKPVAAALDQQTQSVQAQQHSVTHMNSNSVVPAAGEDLPPPAHPAPATSGTGALPTGGSAFSGPLSGDALAREWGTGPGAVRNPAGLGDAEPVTVGATGNSAGPVYAPTEPIGGLGGIERAHDEPPFDGAPDLAPAPSTTAGSGSAGSFFVPIAALLALLALVAPAIVRRLGEGADFRAPAPFVCALERPG